MSISTETIDNSYLLFIRSNEVVQNTTDRNTDMTITLEAEITRNNPLQDIHLQLNSCYIPHSFYNISESLGNNSLSVNGSIDLIFSPKHYDIYTLVDDINSGGSGAVSIGLTASFDENKSKITLTNTSGSSMTINFGVSTGFAKLIGFPQEDFVISNSSSREGFYVVNLNTIHSLFVHTNLPVNNVITTKEGNYRNIIQKIPVKSQFGDVINYNPYENGIFSTIINQNSINNFNISLRDQNDILLDLNNVNFELSFLFEIHQQKIPEQIGDGRGRRSDDGFIEEPQIDNLQLPPSQINNDSFIKQSKKNRSTNINQIPINQLGFLSQTKSTPVINIPKENNKEDEKLHDKQAHKLQQKIIDLQLSVLDDII
jgi:hypothetical protein